MIGRHTQLLARSLAPAAMLAATIALLPAALVAAGTQPVWTELTWRFPIDQWGSGKTFRCRARDCGREIDIHLRAKIGFCNCTTGIADDEELARIADFDLFGDRALALAPGRAVRVRAMTGRSRLYAIVASPAQEKAILTIGLNRRCDAIVATVLVESGTPADLEPTVLDFLSSDTVARWTRTTFGP
jgi:hypothetical protein